MEAIERIKNFEINLLNAFDKMIRGINIELSEQGKQDMKKYCTDRWWFIQSINADETINICSSSHYICKGIHLKEVKI